jgi:hypothetical protein
MTERFRRRFDITVDELQRLMHCVVEHAEPHEARDVERVLSALVTLSARHAGDAGGDRLSFVPPRDTAPIVQRALAAMRRADRHDARARRTRS